MNYKPWKNYNKIKQLDQKVENLQNERKKIHGNYTDMDRTFDNKQLDRLDKINHQLPFLRTEIENLKRK